MITKYKAWGWASLFLIILASVYLFMFAITDDWAESLIITVFGFPAHLIFIVFGSGCIIKGFFQIAERPILKAAIAGKQPKDGHRVAIFGTIEPISEPTHSPFGQKAVSDTNISLCIDKVISVLNQAQERIIFQ